MPSLFAATLSSLARSVPPRMPLLSHWLSSLACQRLPSPAIVVAAVATNSGRCTRQIIAVPPPRKLSLFCLCRHLS
jgi:hypothetical protein